MHVSCIMILLNFPEMRTSSYYYFSRCHPGPGIPHSSSIGTSIAMQQIDVEYFGLRFVVLIAMTELTRQLLNY